MKTTRDQKPKKLTPAEMVETLAEYPAVDLAVVLTEVSKEFATGVALDRFQQALLPLTVHNNEAYRERIYRLRLICGLLLTNSRK